jgi:hypothetical protein
VLGSGVETLNADTQRLNTNLLEHQIKLERLTENVTNVKLGIEEESVVLDGISRNLASLGEEIDNIANASYDGTFTWNITNFQMKMSKLCLKYRIFRS